VLQRHFPRERSGWLTPLFRLLFAIPRRIICNSDAVKACIAGYGVNPEKIVAIPAFSRQYLEFSNVPLPAQVEEFFGRYPAIVFTYVRMRPLFYPVTLIDGMANVMKRRPDVGLIICGGTGHADEGVWPSVQEAIQRQGVGDRICFVDDLDHDAFLTALQRSALYLRTPITDGVASSVLESLALGVPVVACENGTRPAGVLTYPADDAGRMAATVEHVLSNRAEVLASMTTLDVPDTVGDEIAVLTS
jgi:glycosyltransferase involved in cell wall biosynthesis